MAKSVSPANDAVEEVVYKPLTRRERRTMKIKFWRNVVLGVSAFLGLFLYWGFKPIKGDMYYGICRVFLEKKFVYPQSMRISELDWYKEEQRIFYNVTEPFGSTLSGEIRCQYAKPTAETPYLITGVTINKQKIPDEEIARFNKTIPIILANPPDLGVPRTAGGKCMQSKKDKKLGRQRKCAISAEELKGLKVRN